MSKENENNFPRSNHILCEPLEFEEPVYGLETSKINKENENNKKSEKPTISDEDLMRIINPTTSKVKSIRVFKLIIVNEDFDKK